MNGHLTVFYRQDSLSITGFTYMEHGTVRRKFRIISSIRKYCLRGFCCVFLNLCHCFTLFGFFRNLLCNFFCSRGCLFDSRLLLIPVFPAQALIKAILKTNTPVKRIVFILLIVCLTTSCSIQVYFHSSQLY